MSKSNLSVEDTVKEANSPEAVNPITVANYLLQIGENLSPLKLIKLVYLCHGWNLAFNNKPLLIEKPQAWRYGPVLPSLYYAIRHFGTSAVKHPIDEGDDIGSPALVVHQKDIIENVYKAYKEYTPRQLSKMTHREGTPWQKTWDVKGRNAIIPDALIRDHFLGILNA